MNTTMKAVIMALALTASTEASALRCGNVLINEGSTIGDVLRNCAVEDEYEVNNTQADTKYIYIKEGTITNKLTIIDGTVRSIDY